MESHCLLACKFSAEKLLIALGGFTCNHIVFPHSFSCILLCSMLIGQSKVPVFQFTDFGFFFTFASSMFLSVIILAFSIPFIILFSSRIFHQLFLLFPALCKLLILFIYGFSDLIELAFRVFLQLNEFPPKCSFEFSFEEITELHVFQIDYKNTIVILWWYSVSLPFCIPCNFASLSLRLKQQSPPPVFSDYLFGVSKPDIFAPVVCWKFSAGNLVFQKGSLIHG